MAQASKEKSIMYVSGLDGQVELLSDRVIIHRKGFINSLFFGYNYRREIPLGQISEVAYRQPTRLKYGIIEFVRSGRSTDEKKGGTCIVKFNRAGAVKFEALKEKAFQLLHKNQTHN